MILDKDGNGIATAKSYDFGPSSSMVKRWWKDILQKEAMQSSWFDKFMPSPILDQHGKNYDRPIKVSKINDKIRVPFYGDCIPDNSPYHEATRCQLK